jgi:hypothetical protein
MLDLGTAACVDLTVPWQALPDDSSLLADVSAPGGMGGAPSGGGGRGSGGASLFEHGPSQSRGSIGIHGEEGSSTSGGDGATDRAVAIGGEDAEAARAARGGHPDLDVDASIAGLVDAPANPGDVTGRADVQAQGGAPATGGAVGTGGVAASGGTTSSGGAVGSGGVTQLTTIPSRIAATSMARVLSWLGVGVLGLASVACSDTGETGSSGSGGAGSGGGSGQNTHPLHLVSGRRRTGDRGQHQSRSRMTARLRSRATSGCCSTFSKRGPS